MLELKLLAIFSTFNTISKLYLIRMNKFKVFTDLNHLILIFSSDNKTVFHYWRYFGASRTGDDIRMQDP